ncbi:histidinol dehydrogenase [Pelagirhabdus alkalitolerans]|uniref:Histidinol dehydrogenase n=1 Tax=Pelagirhabdus alkalitolerans TaxID=1612202 RepID=A0A1G6H6Y1_9BACI|nr:histidinol dehydrogenase [Pelagirhabdus alkalitolerans]SDB89913.1 histidinol dehydrogenase [Pelagirhabdus alkalitolerans]
MIKTYSSSDFQQLLSTEGQTSLQNDQAYTVAKEVIADIQRDKDKALDKYVEKFDRAVPDSYLVSEEERRQAWDLVDDKTIQALKRAAENIRTFHRKQLQESKFMQHDASIISGQLYRAIEKVGIYVPGGTATYPSSVLMNAIPAVLAGVEEVVMVSPARNGKSISPLLSVAADLAGVHAIYKIGGIQAIAALSYGTETIPSVDKIVGPGNAYVAAAKSLVYGDVGIDMIAGPSEVAIIADESADPRSVAADLIAQAEHDTKARSFLLTPSQNLIEKTKSELNIQLDTLPRASIAKQSLEDKGGLVLVKNLDEAFDLSNALAPEHLEVQLDNPLSYLGKIKHAGSIFLGHYTPESLGDYYAGPNHVLPTSGTAKFASGLSVDDFIKKSTFLYYTKEALQEASEDVIQIAEEEELSGHARAVSKRLTE